MNRYPRLVSQQFTSISRLLCFLFLLSLTSCSIFPTGLTPEPIPTEVTPGPDTSAEIPPLVEISFEVQVPENTPTEAEVSINLLDDVTGLPYNPIRYKMEPIGARRYVTHLPLPLGSLVKYRYSLQGNPSLDEHSSKGFPIDFRIAHISGPALQILDILPSWIDHPYSGQTGRITGVVSDKTRRSGIPNLLVSAGGSQTYTTSDGSFQLDNLSPGTHNFVVHSLDGSYETFQQGAIVAADSTTPIEVGLSPVRYVNVTFFVRSPDEHIVNLPIRMAGNLYHTGNMYANLAGGMRTIASRMPLLTLNPDGRYTITLALPVGSDFRYKYTLGDGFWNSEQTTDGQFRLRQLIVPDQDAVIEDEIRAWRSEGFGPITFEVQVPEYTPSDDFVSIQFNPFNWTEPVPMWSLNNNRWLYVLFGPLQNLDTIQYRYCRSDQCQGHTQVATDASTEGQILTFSPSTQPQSVKDEILAWDWFQLRSDQTTINPVEVSPRSSPFITGIEFQSNYHPSWQSRYPITFQNIYDIGSQRVVIPVTWTFSSQNPLVLEQTLGNNPSWNDLDNTINQAKAWGMNVALFPVPRFMNGSIDQWWLDSPRDATWWDEWFKRYRTFLVNYADLGSQTNADALILGGEWLYPALTGGILTDGSPSGVPDDANERWRGIINEVRSRFPGRIMWALDYSGVPPILPPFMDVIDDIYLLWSAPVSNNLSPTTSDLEAEIGRLLDSDIAPLQETLGKPVILALAFPSADGASMGCVPLPEGECLSWEMFDRPKPDFSTVDIDLQEQQDIYNAFFTAINQRHWVSGLISRGYYPPTNLQDKSASIHGKPAAEVLSYWFPQLNLVQLQGP